jgi:hypothetical protein
MNQDSEIMNDEAETMSDTEFYHVDLFGAVVDVSATSDESEDLIGPKAKAEFNIWSLTDAVGARKKRDAWVLYQKALSSGMAAEEVFYKIVWQVKTLLLASRCQSAEEAGMKTFPFGKAKANLKNWKEGELEKLSHELVVGYHKARRGEGEIETLIEKIILKL